MLFVAQRGIILSPNNMVVNYLDNLKKMFPLLYKIYARIQLHKTWQASDYFIVSFPKSGRTWTMTFLGKYISLYFKTPYYDHFRVKPLWYKGPRLVFSHTGFAHDQFKKGKNLRHALGTNSMARQFERLNKKNIIYIARDPRDVAVSYYFHCKHGGEKDVICMNLEQFVRDKYFGIEVIIMFMNLWMNKRHVFGSFNLIHYEELRKNPREQFKRLLELINIPVKEALLDEAIKFSDFKNMKEREMQKKINAGKDYSDVENPDSYRVRSGKSGGYVEHFNEDTLKYVNSEMRLLDRQYKYGP